VCGDGAVNNNAEPGTEECDDGDSNADTGACTTTCKAAACGDGLTQASNSEECDDGDSNADSGACTTTCTAATCGDGFVQPSNGEACDDSNDVDGDGWYVMRPVGRRGANFDHLARDVHTLLLMQ